MFRTACSLQCEVHVAITVVHGTIVQDKDDTEGGGATYAIVADSEPIKQTRRRAGSASIIVLVADFVSTEKHPI